MTLPEHNKQVKRNKGLDSSLFRLPQFTRMNRHLISLARHSTIRKIANLILVELEYRLRRINLRSRPYIIIVDPMNICNLSCPLCPSGTGDLGREQQKMSWDVFTKTLDDVAPYAYEVNLHNWGEPLLHPRIFEMIEYSRKKNLATNMSTNFNLISDEQIDKLILSGLEYLILSIDGMTQQNYGKYRVGGNIENVLDNVRKLVKRRRELGRTSPFIEWQFIVFRHNSQEVDEARTLAKQIGVDRFRVIPPGLPFDATDLYTLKREWFLPKLDEHGKEIGVESFREELKSSCFYLYRSFTVNPDGGTAPCCVVYNEKNDFGDIKTQKLKKIWNNEKYLSARSLFKKGAGGAECIVCDRCKLFKKHGKPASRVSIPEPE